MKHKFLTTATLTGVLAVSNLGLALPALAEDGVAVTDLDLCSSSSYTLTADTVLTAGIVVTSGCVATLDLNGYTLSYGENITTGFDLITVDYGGTLTITDSAGTGKIDASYEAKDINSLAIFNSGAVTIEGGTFTTGSGYDSSLSKQTANTYYLIENHGEMTIYGGSFSSEDLASSLIDNGYYGSSSKGAGHQGVYTEGSNYANPTLTIYGGSFSGGYNAIKNDDNSVLYVYDGTFTNSTQVTLMDYGTAYIYGGTWENTAEGEDVIFVGSYCDDTDPGVLVVEGGTFTSTFYILYAGGYGLATPVQISGGEFSYGASFWDANNFTANADECADAKASIPDATVITGGTFSMADIAYYGETDTDAINYGADLFSTDYYLMKSGDVFKIVLAADYADESKYTVTKNEDGSVTIEELEEEDEPEDTEPDSDEPTDDGEDTDSDDESDEGEEVNNPKTADSIVLYATLASLSLAGAGITSRKMRKA